MNEQLAREGMERLGDILNASSVGLPIETFPLMIDALLNGHGLIIDIKTQNITVIKDDEIFDDRSEPPSEYTPRQ